MSMVDNNKACLDKLDQAWPLIQYVYLAEGSNAVTVENSLHNANGIAAYVTVILAALGWQPMKYSMRVDALENEWKLSNKSYEPFPVMEVISEIIESYHLIQIDNAREHFHGDSTNDTTAGNPC